MWTISDLYLPIIVGYYGRAKFRVDHFGRSGRVRVGKKPECTIGASLASFAPLNKLLGFSIGNYNLKNFMGFHYTIFQSSMSAI
jgi:hypothetical protein